MKIGGVWPQEATDAVLELTQQRPLQAQIINYEEGIPVIDLYLFLGPTVSYDRFFSIFDENQSFFDINSM